MNSEKLKPQEREKVGRQDVIIDHPQGSSNELVSQIRQSAEVIARQKEVRVHDKSGRVIFKGTPAQLGVFYRNKDYGAIENLGDISGPDGKSIVRFGESNASGFIKRDQAPAVFNHLAKMLEQTGQRQSPESKLKIEEKRELDEEEVKTLANEAGMFIRNYESKEPRGMFEEGYNGEALGLGRLEVDPEIGKHFQAHGIAKGTIGEQLRSLNQLLGRGIDKEKPFYTTALRLADEEEAALAGAVGTLGPYEGGSFIVISEPDRSIKDGVGGVVVNEHFYNTIPKLEERFPGVEFIKASELANTLKRLLSAESKSK